jgi:hypothetical protein
VLLLRKHQLPSTLNLLPVPKKIELQKGMFILTQNFGVGIHEPAPDTILINAVNRTYQTLKPEEWFIFYNKTITSKDNSDSASLQITVKKAVLPSLGHR